MNAGTIAGTSLLTMSCAPGPTGLNSLGNVQPVWVCQNPGGATVQGFVLTNMDTMVTGFTGRTITLTLWKCAFNSTPFTGPTLWSGSVVPGTPLTLGIGTLLAQGDSIVAQASFANSISIEIDGAVAADLVTQQLIGQTLQMNQVFGADIPSVGEISAAAESTP